MIQYKIECYERYPLDPRVDHKSWCINFSEYEEFVNKFGHNKSLVYEVYKNNFYQSFNSLGFKGKLCIYIIFIFAVVTGLEWGLKIFNNDYKGFWEDWERVYLADNYENAFNWIEEDKKEDLKYISQKIGKTFYYD